MNILLICTGNTCRSPMAEYYLKSKNLDDLSVKSRGFSEGENAIKCSFEGDYCFIVMVSDERGNTTSIMHTITVTK